MDRTEPKPRGILPTRSDTPASGSKALAPLRPSGSLKMVKFKDNREEDTSSLSLSLLQSQVTTSIPSKTNTTSTFHRQSSSIPISIRRRSSLDLPPPSLSLPPPAHTTSLSSSKSALKSITVQQNHASSTCHTSLTSIDLSLDIYQAAATIVNQVLQAVSNSLDAQNLSPVSSGRYETMSSSDSALHSTGSRIHSNYNSIASNIFSSSSVIISDSPNRSLHSASPSFGIFSRKPMSRETLTNAFLKVDSTPNIKSYERRSSEPCQTSVQLSLQAFNSIKFSKQAVEDKQRKISRTDDDIGRGKTWRRGSLDGFSFERRSSCGFKDPVLSRFAEELMKADTSVPELVIVGSHPGSSSTGSRRSSVCAAYRECTQANLESELLNTSFTSVCSLPVSHSSHSQYRRDYMDRSRSRESHNWQSDSSDTEYWFPPPKIVGDEFQQEYNRQHSQEDLQDYASFFAGRVVQEAVCVLKCDPAYMSREEQDVELFAENLMDQIMRDALLATVHDDSLIDNRRERGDGSRRSSSALLVSSTLKSGSGDANHKMYYLEGARPKTVTPVWTRSKTKTIQQKRKDNEPDSHRTGNDSRISRSVEGHRERRTSMIGSNERLVSKQYSCARSPSSAADLETSRQNSLLHQNTANVRPSPTKLKKRSTPGSTSLLPSMSTSTKPPLAIHRVQSGTSQFQHQPHQTSTLKTRRKFESSSVAASSIPVYHGSSPSQSSHSKMLSKTQSHASSASSLSSHHSEQTELSYPSSSGSESVGPTGKSTSSRKQRERKELEYRSKVSHSVVSGQHRERSRRRDSYVRKTDVHAKRRSDKDRTLHSEPVMQQCPAIDQFATSLSMVVMDNALLHCQDNRWLRPIATGNWGCGAFRGNVQLKLVLQWIAASVSQTPSLIYYTYNDRRLLQAQEIANLMSGQTVGHLAEALRDYCNWVRLYLASLSSSFFSSSTRPHLHHQSLQQQAGTSYSAWKDEHDSWLPQTLFDFFARKIPNAGR